MANAAQIREHMEVVGDDGKHVGVVDHVDDRRITLTRRDEAAHGKHHYLPLAWVVTVADTVQLDRSAEQARREWSTELPSGERSGPGGVGG